MGIRDCKRIIFEALRLTFEADGLIGVFSQNGRHCEPNLDGTVVRLAGGNLEMFIP